MNWFFFILAVVVGFAICYFTIARKHKIAAHDYKGWYQSLREQKSKLYEELADKETQLQEALGRVEAAAKVEAKKVASKLRSVGGKRVVT